MPLTGNSPSFAYKLILQSSMYTQTLRLQKDGQRFKLHCADLLYVYMLARSYVTICCHEDCCIAYCYI